MSRCALPWLASCPRCVRVEPKEDDMKARGNRRAGLVLAALGAMLAVPALAQAAAPKWAVVSSAGALVRGSGATAATALSTGTYQVTFNSNMAGCAYIA